MMAQSKAISPKANGNGTRHQRIKAVKAAPKPHAPGSPPNLCVVASPDELAFITAQGVGKAKVVHAALRLLQEYQNGTIQLASPAPEYLTLTPKPKAS